MKLVATAPNIKYADIETAASVINTEIQGLERLLSSLGETYIDVINLLSTVKGRVIFSGIGKSGHIAHKITSTFSSTGTPAQFVHASEASHGDLGMITKDDIVLILSNSGESPELASILNYTKRFNIPLVAITQRKNSSLSEAADYVLILPKSEEACPLGLAPTTSTTMMLCLGDALAVSLLKRKGFSKDDFKVFHPGGQLGKALMHVEDIMHIDNSIPLARENADLSEILLTMTAKSFGCVGIINQDHTLIGIITDGDIRRHMSPKLLTYKAQDIYTKTPKTISKRQLASEALKIMNENAITSLFVVENHSPVGILHLHDCLREGIK